VCGSALTDSQALGRLNEVAIAIEFDVEEDSSYRWTAWEWV